MRLPLTVLAAVCALLMATAAAPAAASAPKPAVGDGSDIAALLTGEPVARPLNAQLQLLFETFLSDAAPGATEAVQLEVSYTYALAPEPAPRARVSILFQPLMPFAVPDDPAFIARLAGRIRQWFELYRPSDQGAQLSFDLSATQPLEHARGVTLAVADTTDLDGATPPAPGQPAMDDSGVMLRRADTTSRTVVGASPPFLGSALPRQRSAGELGPGRWRIDL